MGKGIATIHVKGKRGTITLLGMGKTPRGQRFIRSVLPITAKKMHGKEFKKELALAVEDMLA